MNQEMPKKLNVKGIVTAAIGGVVLMLGGPLLVSDMGLTPVQRLLVLGVLGAAGGAVGVRIPFHLPGDSTTLAQGQQDAGGDN